MSIAAPTHRPVIHSDRVAVPGTGRLWLGMHSRSRHQLSVQFGLDDLRFSASYWYADADLIELEARWGSDFMERIYFHITAFTANALLSLAPARFDPGPYAAYCGPEFSVLWSRIFDGVWAQWRYEHDLADYGGPLIEPRGRAGERVALAPADDRALAFVGGGKDSVVSVRLLEKAHVACDTLVYSSSGYGSAQLQHRLCDGLLDALDRPAESRRRVWLFDDVAESPLLQLGPVNGMRGMTTAETPASVFAALPLVLQHGYSYLCLGHERSADIGNLTWRRTGEEVNHQWGKSVECETLLADYLCTYLIADCVYFSPLKPAYDVLILQLLRDDLVAVPSTHSCNIHKPWCGRCPKCAYVWLSYHAYLPRDVVESTFVGLGNLFDAPENQLSYRQLLGLEEHTPFECVGGVNEARLAFELCRHKGIRGAAMSVFEAEVPAVKTDSLLDRYLSVGTLAPSVPAPLRTRLDAVLKQAAAEAMERLAPQ